MRIFYWATGIGYMEWLRQIIYRHALGQKRPKARYSLLLLFSVLLLPVVWRVKDFASVLSYVSLLHMLPAAYMDAKTMTVYAFLTQIPMSLSLCVWIFSGTWAWGYAGLSLLFYVTGRCGGYGEADGDLLFAGSLLLGGRYQYDLMIPLLFFLSSGCFFVARYGICYWARKKRGRRQTERYANERRAFLPEVMTAFYLLLLIGL